MTSSRKTGEEARVRDHEHVTIPYSADQLTEGITRALKAGDAEAVYDFLRVLAVVNPRRAQDVMDTIELGLTIAERAAR